MGACYASQDNLTAAKALGVTDIAFHKKRDLAVEDMVKSRWVYRKLRNFRAGIEAGISCLKRAYGLARCTWRGLDHFKIPRFKEYICFEPQRCYSQLDFCQKRV